ncbi:MAG: hemN, partial [Acidimicrobiaceae bacterium]|nr:hemN [Acidimicrobiaceae bacterium]
YELADERLGQAGLFWYEVSNWALPGHECRHNDGYWLQRDYLGFGCSAHSHRAGERSWNIFSLERYLAAVESGRGARAGSERLDDATRAREGLELSLRTRRGVPRDALSPRAVAALGGEGELVAASGERWVLTRRGRLLANEVCLVLNPHVPEPAPAR